jgi:very-short-patch-repair endonuclease
MAKKGSYSNLVKKAMAKAKFAANPSVAQVKKKKKLQRMANKMSNKMTEPERIFADMMDELGVEYESQKIIDNKIFDFYIPSKNVIVEIDGDYFHGNPLIYEEKDLNKMQIRNQRNDSYKEILAKGRGFDLVRVWEYDLKNDYKEQEKRFKKMLKDE